MGGGAYVRPLTNTAKFVPVCISGRFPAIGRGGGKMHGWRDFLFSNLRPEKYRRVDKCKMAQSTRIRAHITLLRIKIYSILSVSVTRRYYLPETVTRSILSRAVLVMSVSALIR